MTALLARQYIDGSKPDTPQGVNVANLELGLGNAWDCLQTLGVGLTAVAAGVAALTQANAGLLLVDATAGNVTINMPACSAAVGALFQFKRVDNTPANTVTINRAGSDTIDSKSSVTLVDQFDFVAMRSDGVSAWDLLTNAAVAARETLTAGTLTAYTLTPALALNAYKAGRSYWVRFHAASGAAPTIAISGLGSPPNLVRQLTNGTYSNIGAGDIPVDHRSRVTLLSTTQALVETLPPATAPDSSLQLNTANGYGGAGSPVIRRFTNIAKQRGSYATDFTVALNGTVGTEITVNTSDYYTLSYSESVSASQVFGISINSSQLTTQYLNINQADRLTGTATESTNGVGHCGGRFWIPAGSVLRPHTNSVSGGTAGFCQLDITRG